MINDINSISYPFEEEGFTFSMSARIDKAGTTERKQSVTEQKFCIKHFDKNCIMCFAESRALRCYRCKDYKKYPCKKCKAENNKKLFKVYSKAIDTVTTFGNTIVSYDHFEYREVMFPRCVKCNPNKRTVTVKIRKPDIRMIATVSEKVTKW